MKMGKKFITGLAALFLAGHISYGQNRVVCGSDQYQEQHKKERSELLQLENRLNNEITRSPRAEDTNVLVIPVVFHIVHQGGAENITKKTVEDQVATLNDAFRMQNKDTGNI